jgi:hypothetical protein
MSESLGDVGRSAGSVGTTFFHKELDQAVHRGIIRSANERCRLSLLRKQTDSDKGFDMV